MDEAAPGIAFLPLRTPTLAPATHTNCVFLGDGADLVAVDPGTPWEDERFRLRQAVDRLRAAGRRVRAILITHHHVDHLEAAAWLRNLAGAEIVAHARAAALAAPLAIDRFVDDGEEIVAGSLAFEVLHTPGHASDHLCLWEPASRTLVAGDMIASQGTIVVDPPDGDMSDYLDSLDRLRDLLPVRLLPAHGGLVEPGLPKIDEYITHRRWREARVLDALRAARRAVAPGDLVPSVYTDVQPTMFPLAERSLLAHLLKLVKDGRAVREDEKFAAG